MNDGAIVMGIDEVCAKIKNILDMYLENADREELSGDADLSDWGVDSISFIQTIVDIEAQFGIEIPDECLLMEKMGTVNKMTDIIYRLINENIA